MVVRCGKGLARCGVIVVRRCCESCGKCGVVVRQGVLINGAYHFVFRGGGNTLTIYFQFSFYGVLHERLVEREVVQRVPSPTT